MNSMEKANPVQPAELEWRDDQLPISTSYDDVYFSTVSGLDETRHVFLNANHLPERFKQLKADDCFVIGETGFGTGLNFFCAWQLFSQLADPKARLHFISVEKHPLTVDDFNKALKTWPELEPFTSQLENLCLHATPGQQHFVCAEGRIRLTLLIGDVLEQLPKLEAEIDAWFLDGFTPSKNPDMWQPELFPILASKSHKETTFATFTAARVVRDGLIAAGFELEKIEGYGQKRNMLKGRLISQPEKAEQRPVWLQQEQATQPAEKNVIVIGGGLSGTSTARSLAERGWKVRLLERHNALAQEASGNPQGILYAKLSANETPLSRYILQGYQYTINLLKRLDRQGHSDLWEASGVIQMATSEKVAKRYQSLADYFPSALLQYLDPEKLSDIAGLSLENSGLFFPEAGWAKPGLICQTLANHPDISVITETEITSMKQGEDGIWNLQATDSRTFQSSHVVVACATASQNLEQFSHIPLKPIRGQITTLAATPESQKLKTTVCGEGYAAPAEEGFHTIGATFDFHSQSNAVTDEDHQKNLAMQEEWTPAFHEAFGGIDAEILGGRASFRCTTPDYLPVVGAMVDRDQFQEDFAMLRKNVKHRFSNLPIYHKGLYINAGHGSRGLITCPLSGEVLAAMMSGEPSPASADLLDHLNPTRFLFRQMSRNQ